ncbi:MAG: hypothetical protein EBQ98_03040 [Actinobacteria bacterium]|nr:hypothetical protein [Actinomycetota bacterium]
MSALAKRLKVQSFVIFTVLCAGLVAVPSSAQAASATCNGLVATITSSARVINGTSGADVIVVQGAGVHSVNSGNGNDVICGSVGDDTINSGPGNDTVLAGDGNDVISSLDGNDTVNGGSGNDTISSSAGNDTIAGGDGNDALTAGDGSDQINSGSGNDSVTAGSGDDTISAGFGDDTISAGTGDDTVTGDAGTDSIKGDAGTDTISGGAGNDTISAGTENDAVTGDAGTDSIQGDAGNDTISGGAGNDTISGGDDPDRLNGDAGADSLSGGAGNDTLQGGSDKDNLNPGAGTNYCATDAADSIVGSCTIDNSGPGVSNASVTSNVRAGSTLTFIWSVNDNSAVDSSWVKIGGPSGWVTTWCGFGLEGTRVSGNSQGSVFSAQCPVPQNAVNTEYTAFFDATDVFGQMAQSSTATFRIIGGETDASAPVVTNIAVSSPTLAYGQTLDITYDVADETGLQGIIAWVALDGYGFANNQGRSYVDYANSSGVFSVTRISGDEKDGKYLQQISLNSFAPAGEYTLWISVIDKLGNKVFYQTTTKFKVN